MHVALSTVVALVLYFAVLIGIGLITYKKMRIWKATPWGDGRWVPGSRP